MQHPLMTDWAALEIDTIVVPPTSGRIGMTVCPGRKAPGLRMAGWSRDLLSDLDTIRAAGASALVSLMEGWELETYGVPPDLLATEVRAREMEWYHLPIPDMGVPDEPFEERWGRVGAEVHRRLAGGELIVVHCLAGLGRTGLLTARVLVEAGTAPAYAVEAVRRARPGTIQTERQERHVLALSGARCERREP